MLHFAPRMWSMAAVLSAGFAFAQDQNQDRTPEPPPAPAAESTREAVPAPPAAGDRTQTPRTDAAPGEPLSPPPAPRDETRPLDQPAANRIENEYDDARDADRDQLRDADRDQLRDEQRLDTTQRETERRTFDDRPNHGRQGLGVWFGQGMTVSRVVPNGPAARIGLQPGDQLVSINGQQFADVNLMVTEFGRIPRDQDIEVVFIRDGQEHVESTRLAGWDELYPNYMAAGSGQYGAQPYMAMRPVGPDGGYIEGGFVEGAPCCAPVATCCEAQPFVGGGYGHQVAFAHGYGGGFDPCCDDGWDRASRRAQRRAARRGCCW
ncbi:MAG: PDZ domain-containing protein [Planctomyces sp.]|nr:PDZ domain-containing protein [Planctomyces sp.]